MVSVFRAYSDWSETDPVEGCDGKLVWETKTGPYKESWICFPLLFTVSHSQAVHVWRGRDDPSKSTYLHICSNAGLFAQGWQAHGQCGCWKWTSEHLHPLFYINKFPHLAKSFSFSSTQLIFKQRRSHVTNFQVEVLSQWIFSSSQNLSLYCKCKLGNKSCPSTPCPGPNHCLQADVIDLIFVVIFLESESNTLSLGQSKNHCTVTNKYKRHIAKKQTTCWKLPLH